MNGTKTRAHKQCKRHVWEVRWS